MTTESSSPPIGALGASAQLKRRSLLRGVAAGLVTLPLLPATRAAAQPVPALQVRRNIYGPGMTQTIQALRTGVTAMMARPVTDPISWRFQANIHGTTDSPNLTPLSVGVFVSPAVV